jgi:hypothetical protein
LRPPGWVPSDASANQLKIFLLLSETFEPVSPLDNKEPMKAAEALPSSFAFLCEPSVFLSLVESSRLNASREDF